MRRPNMSDCFKLARYLKQANAKEKLNQIFKSYEDMEKTESESEAGYSFFLDLLFVLSDAKMEEAIYDVFSGIFEVPKEEVANLHPTDFYKCIVACDDWGSWGNFFAQAFK